MDYILPIEGIEVNIDAKYVSKHLTTVTIHQLDESTKLKNMDEIQRLVENLPKDNICLFWLVNFSKKRVVRQICVSELEERMKSDEKYMDQWVALCLQKTEQLRDEERYTAFVFLLEQLVIFGKQFCQYDQDFAKSAIKKFEDAPSSPFTKKFGSFDYLTSLYEQFKINLVQKQLFKDDITKSDESKTDSKLELEYLREENRCLNLSLQTIYKVFPKESKQVQPVEKVVVDSDTIPESGAKDDQVKKLKEKVKELEKQIKTPESRGKLDKKIEKLKAKVEKRDEKLKEKKKRIKELKKGADGKEIKDLKGKLAKIQELLQ